VVVGATVAFLEFDWAIISSDTSEEEALENVKPLQLVE
jgi:hypothetical protein